MNDEQLLKTNLIERGSRQLSFETSTKINNEISQSIESANYDKRLSKSEIYELYKQEIDELIKEERKKITIEYDLKFKKEVFNKEKELNDAVKVKNQDLDEQIDKFKKFLVTINEDFNNFCNKEIIQLDTLIINMVFEVLYKITGNNSGYQDLVGAVVKDALVKKISDFKNLTIKLSKEDYIFFKKKFSEESWITNIKVDDRLSIGRIVLDDGFSLFECGLVDQLDSLRAEFISVLRSNYE